MGLRSFLDFLLKCLEGLRKTNPPRLPLLLSFHSCAWAHRKCPQFDSSSKSILFCTNGNAIKDFRDQMIFNIVCVLKMRGVFVSCHQRWHSYWFTTVAAVHSPLLLNDRID